MKSTSTRTLEAIRAMITTGDEQRDAIRNYLATFTDDELLVRQNKLQKYLNNKIEQNRNRLQRIL